MGTGLFEPSRAVRCLGAMLSELSVFVDGAGRGGIGASSDIMDAWLLEMGACHHFFGRPNPTAASAPAYRDVRAVSFE